MTDLSNSSADRDSVTQRLATVQKLFVRHSAAIRGYLFAMAPDPDVVDDLLHEVFLCVTLKSQDFEPGTNFTAWARAIARIEVVRAARSRRRFPGGLSAEAIELLAEAAPEMNLSEDRLALLDECRRQLSPRARQVVDLRYGESLKPAAIAKRLRLAVESVYVTLSRARALLRECLERKLSPSEETA
jgi:RNA polymerase sigma-70 factor (ECF subfamily)